MSRKFDFLVFIGRFQPFHVGHLEVIQTALDQADKVIVLVGSSNQPRTEKNPFNFEERRTMIYDSLAVIDATTNTDYSSRVFVRALQDHKYNDQKWAIGVQNTVDAVIREQIVISMYKDFSHLEDLNKPKVGLIGHSKDESSYYLKMFPQWHLVEHTLNEMINATDLRRLMFEGKSLKFLQGVVPEGAMGTVADFAAGPAYDLIRSEYEMIKKYKKAWEAAPYAPMFITTDAVVIQSGHILLVERGAAPGKGLWALPGGFLEQKITILQNMIKELREEARIKVPEPVLIGSIKEWHVFDRPDRSARGRTVTHAALIELPAGALPIVKGGDDAAKAFWVPISEIREDKMFEDHWHIIQYFLGQI